MPKRYWRRVSSVKMRAGSGISVEGSATVVMPMDWAVWPLGKRTWSGCVVGYMSRVAATASVWRSKMLSDPVSAHEEGDCILIIVSGATGIGIEVEERVWFEIVFSLTLSKVIANLSLFSIRCLVPMRWPNLQPRIAVFPPGGVRGSLAERCWAV